MTERLYYTDPYLATFDATVTGVRPVEDRFAVTLDRTAFYPTSGGQPFDVGRLGGASVLDVVDEDDGTITHVVDRAVAGGSAVRCEVDWPRRFDHMQQHTGQHILSAAFDTLLGARTESFHLGSDSSTIDLAREVTPAEIARAEADANRIVWEDREVAIRFVDAADAAALPLRKETGREGTLRLIDVTGYDLSACGGTHVRRTGAVGIIAVAGWERFRGGSRVAFVCGGRALRAHAGLRDVTAASARLLSASVVELPAAIERLQADVKEARRQVKDALGRLAVHDAQALAAAAPDGIVVAALDGLDQNGLKQIASAIVASPGRVAALVTAGTPAAVVVARSADAAADCGAVLRQLIARFGGKGGGRPELAQGGGLAGDPAGIVAALRELLRPAAL